MKGKVTAFKLNVRRLPARSADRLGTLHFNTIVDILDEIDAWVRIRFNGGYGFVYGDYLDELPPEVATKGIVTTKLLNVREQPGISGEIRGTLSRNTVVDIEAEHGDWYEIGFNGAPGFVHHDYLQLVEAKEPCQGLVTAERLNVRKQPSLTAGKAGTLVRNSVIDILAEFDEWLEIRFNGQAAYVHSAYVEVLAQDEGEPPAETGFLYQRPSLQIVPLAPENKLAVSGAFIERQIARTWNAYGNLLEKLSRAAGIDTASAVAVLNVESAGKGFSSDQRMIIRFENHKFWKYWGRSNPDVFHDHFKYRSDKVWLGHMFRATTEAEWEKMHTSQAHEWKVLTFARNLDDTAALLSISMGAPQIMGFHHARIGYETVQQMFAGFEKDIRYHIFGLFDFFDQNMIRALKNREFVAFASGYNGSGQAEAYGAKIEQQVEAFRRLIA